MLPRFPDGAWLCELAPITDDAVSRARRRRGRRPPAQPGRPSRRSRGSSATSVLLVILDNCEHLLDAVAELVDAVLAAARTSRCSPPAARRSAVAGERTCGVGDARATTAAAVRLFVDRAGAARHDFAVDARDAAIVEDICRRLDGIPLAIELAAARVRSLTPAQILERLDERFRLLTGGAGAPAVGHQTLRAALTWSTDLLEPDELRGVRRGCRCSSGRSTSPPPRPSSATTRGSTLDALVDKSLLLAEDSDDGMRYRMLETVREFATEILLLMDGAAADARTQHARHYLAIAEEQGRSLSIEAVHDPHARRPRELQRGLRVVRSRAGRRPRALRLTSAFDTGAIDLAGRPLWDDALAIPGALDHPLGPRLLAMAANHVIATGGEPERAHRQARASLDLAAELGVPVDYFHWVSVGATEMRSGHLDEARAAAREAIALADAPARQSRARRCCWPRSNAGAVSSGPRPRRLPMRRRPLVPRANPSTSVRH